MEMQLPQHIIDLVGRLFDEGMDDDSICLAVLKAWRLSKQVHLAGNTREVIGLCPPTSLPALPPRD